MLLALLAQINVDVSDAYFYRHFLGQSFEHLIEKVKQDFDVVIDDVFRLRYREALLETFSKDLTVTNGLFNLLAKLTLPCCVATSSSPARVTHSLGVVGLDSFFKDRVVTASEVENGKPSPDIFLHAAKKHGVDPENCLVIEDSNAGITAGLAANMEVVRYAGASHTINTEYNDQHRGITTIRDWLELLDTFPVLTKAA